ncbi:hypothetical protein PanWU01x14_170930, partial [Parasponia andersonii]
CWPLLFFVALAPPQRCSHCFYSVCLSSDQGLVVQICLWLFLLTNDRVADFTPFA